MEDSPRTGGRCLNKPRYRRVLVITQCLQLSGRVFVHCPSSLFFPPSLLPSPLLPSPPPPPPPLLPSLPAPSTPCYFFLPPARPLPGPSPQPPASQVVAPIPVKPGVCVICFLWDSHVTFFIFLVFFVVLFCNDSASACVVTLVLLVVLWVCVLCLCVLV